MQIDQCIRKVKQIWTLLKRETVTSARPYASLHCAPDDNHASAPPLSFYRPDALPAAQPTASQHWRHKVDLYNGCKMVVAVLCVQGFILKFVFEPNEYFTNEILTKEYQMKLHHEGPEIVKCKGSVLHYANVEF